MRGHNMTGNYKRPNARISNGNAPCSAGCAATTGDTPTLLRANIAGSDGDRLQW